MLKAGVIGAAGFAGAECTRILLGHPSFELVLITSDADEGHAASEVYPALAGKCDLSYERFDADEVARRCDIVFLAVPHTASLAMTPGFLKAGLIVIDLSADYRLKDPAVYEKWYGVAHTSPDLLEKAAFGIPELTGDRIRALASSQDKLVACAGCYPTATSLACAPALRAGVVTSQMVVSDCLSGISGAGRKLARKSSFCTAHEDARAYGVGTHRHTPEMEQMLAELACRDMHVIFTPHLIPVVRGMLATVHLEVDLAMSIEQIHGIYEDFYAGSSFVHVLPLGAMPGTSEVSGSNDAHIAVASSTEPGHLIVSCAIDNLMKGASGQAVQCANLLLGLPEDTGLACMLPPVV